MERKQIKISLEQPFKPEYTGRYNCTALYKNGRVETISWYIYFYPGKPCCSLFAAAHLHCVLITIY